MSDYKRLRSTLRKPKSGGQSVEEQRHEQLLKDLTDVYNSEPQDTKTLLEFKVTSGKVIQGYKEDTILYPHEYMIKSFDWTTGTSDLAYSLPNTNPGNAYRFEYLKDGRLFVADCGQCVTVDLKFRTRELASITCNDIGLPRGPLFKKLQLTQDESYVVCLTDSMLFKLDLRDRNSLTKPHGDVDSKDEYEFIDLQVLDKQRKVLISQEKKTQKDRQTHIYEYSLNDFELLRVILPDKKFGRFGGFVYSSANSVLFCKDVLGSVMHVYDMKKKFESR